ncbi:UDP-glucose 6-dehydrogenase YwqF [subsurface metagenome]
MTWDNSETVKMCYNTFIGFKIIFANTLMQICHNTPGGDCDVVSEALSLAKDRLISKKYLRGGMGDGGACHPRDNLALSSLSDRLGLDYNIFDFVMTVREKQDEWLADLMCEHKLPKVILGRTFKPDTDLVVGSPSILLANILKERGEEVTFYDPVTDSEMPPEVPSVYLIGTMWEVFKKFPFIPGSVVIDPWRFVDTVPEGVKLIPIGRNPGK